jgi:hypothetical protein
MQELSQDVQMKQVGGRVGSYAISTIDFDSWMNQPTGEQSIKVRKTKETKNVVNKVFSDCADAIDDPFWIEKFHSASLGRLPRCFNYSNGVLVYRKTNKKNILELPLNSDPIEIAYMCMEFFRSNAGIFSPLDKQNTIQYQYAQSQDMINKPSLTWGTSNKKMQQCLLNHYIMDMKTTMGLTNKEGENLRQIILLGIANKYFSKNSIHLKNNRIHQIDGLLWDVDNRVFYINPELKPAVSRSNIRNKDPSLSIDSTSKDTIPLFQVKWKKYGEYLGSQLILYHKRQQQQSSIIGSVPTLIIVNNDSTSLTGVTTDASDYDDDDCYTSEVSD